MKHINNEVIYEIYPLTFNYAPGSKSDPYKGAYGNLKGITAAVEYVASLGVDTIWITPFYPGGGRGFGYDVTDYCAIDPIFGTFEDFKELCDVYHKHNIRVIIDQVYNHCSIKHEWFLKSLDRLIPYEDFFIWSDPKGYDKNRKPIPPNNWTAIWDDSGDGAWTWHARRQQFYLHSFDSSMPNLNINNKKVQKQLLRIAKFWFDLGVDGFRLDAVTHYACDTQLRDNPVDEKGHQIHLYDINTPGGVEFIDQLKNLCDSYATPKTLLAEYWYDKSREGIDKACSIFKRSRCDAFFTGALNCGLEIFKQNIADDLWVSHQGEKLNWAMSNHDLERAASRVFGRYCTQAQVKMAISLLMTLPGSVCLFQGEELGLLNPASIEDCKNPDNDPLKLWTPYKNIWDAGRAGFALSDAPDDVTRRMAFRPDEHHYRYAVSRQNYPNSVLNFTRQAIKARKHGIFNDYGYIHFQENLCRPDVYVYVRTNRDESVKILCAYNFSVNTVEFHFNHRYFRVPAYGVLQERV